jgi:hypothetical protein
MCNKMLDKKESQKSKEDKKKFFFPQRKSVGAGPVSSAHERIFDSRTQDTVRSNVSWLKNAGAAFLRFFCSVCT